MIEFLKLLSLCAALLFAGGVLVAEPANEEEAIRTTLMDYIEGAYETDADRFASAFHPEMTKRGYVFRKEHVAIVPHTKESLVRNVRDRLKKGWIPEGAVIELEILDLQGNQASAKCVAHWGIDYVHLVKEDGKWLIIHVLWQNNEYISRATAE